MATTSPRIQQLDWLRAAALALVLLNHMTFWPEAFPRPLALLIGPWHRAGWAGVDLFFVLSGFLVSGLLFREYQHRGAIDIKRFLIRRGLKIYPMFYLLMGVSLVMQPIVGHPIQWKNFLAEIFFVQNYAGGVLGHTWSLAVEEHFYLGAALLVAWLGARSRAKTKDPFAGIVPCCVTLLFACLGLRILTSFVLPFNHHTHVTPTHLRIDSLALGVLLAYFYYFRTTELATWVQKNRRSLVVAAVALTAPCLWIGYESFFMHTLGFTMLALGFAAMLLVLLHSEPGKLPRSRWAGHFFAALAAVGVNSYSIYLWHYPIRNWSLWFGREITGNSVPYPVELAIYFTLSAVVGIGMAKLLERPMLAWRNHWFPSRSEPVGVERSGIVRIIEPAPERAAA